MENKLNRLTEKELEEKINRLTEEELIKLEVEIEKILEAARKRKDYLERKRELEERCFGFSL